MNTSTLSHPYSMAPSISIPDSVTFEQAIAISQVLLANDSLAETEFEASIAALMQTDNGARGWFVTFLTGESTLADQPTEAILAGLCTAPQRVANLLTRNLAMSTAMILTHNRSNAPEQAAGSARVQQRTQRLIQLLQLPELQTELANLATSVTSANGSYQAFLERWGYDAEQRKAISEAITQLN
jgi:hypothetical protein